jgi:hypothetical protein
MIPSHYQQRYDSGNLWAEVRRLPHRPSHLGRAIAQVVSCLLLTAAARVRAQVRSCGICGGQSDTGAGSLRVLRFPLSILIALTASDSSASIIRSWYERPISGRRTK